MTTEQENFIVDLTDAAKTHVEWLAIIRFGLATLSERQGLLAELIVRECARLSLESSSKKPGDFAAQILAELDLQIIPRP